MADPDSSSTEDPDGPASAEQGDPSTGDSADRSTGDAADRSTGDPADLSTEELRERVERRYDFENFGPADMAEMEPEEWEAAFDPDAWITGEDLLDRVEADLKRRVLDRDVFARVERFDDVVVAYDEQDYAAVYPDGTVEGRGTVRRDVEPTVALCSMDSYDVPEAPAGQVLPGPREIPESSDTLGNTLLQVLGGVQVLAGLVLFGAYVLHVLNVVSNPTGGLRGTNPVLLVVAGIGFVLIGLFLFVVVANARLSDRFRAEAYRDRLRGVGLADGERPAFLAEIDGVDLPGDPATGGDASAGAEGDETGDGSSGTETGDGSPGTETGDANAGTETRDGDPGTDGGDPGPPPAGS